MADAPSSATARTAVSTSSIISVKMIYGRSVEPLRAEVKRLMAR
jgi:hypothetical protein